MRAINHALTGAVIGLAGAEPALAVPAAALSHYVCDALPHFGEGKTGPAALRTPLFRAMLYVDFLLCVGLVLVLALDRPVHWFLMSVCAFAAAAPDLLAINRYRTAIAGRPWRANLYARFAHGIQWFERPIGAVVEIAWLSAALVILIPFLR